MRLLWQYKKLITGGLLTGAWSVETRAPKRAKAPVAPT